MKNIHEQFPVRIDTSGELIGYEPSEREDGYVFAASETYHGRTRIPKEQAEGITRALQNATNLLEKRIQDDTVYPSFSDTIIETFAQQESPRFAVIVTDSMQAFMKTYKAHFPDDNAMQTAFALGGIGGMQIIAEGTKNALKKAIKTKTQDPDDLYPFTPANFVHYGPPKQAEDGVYEVDFEVKCIDSAKQFSDALTKQINTAAIAIAQSPMSNRYDITQPEMLPDNFTKHLTSVIFEEDAIDNKNQ